MSSSPKPSPPDGSTTPLGTAMTRVTAAASGLGRPGTSAQRGGVGGVAAVTKGERKEGARAGFDTAGLVQRHKYANLMQCGAFSAPSLSSGSSGLFLLAPVSACDTGEEAGEIG